MYYIPLFAIAELFLWKYFALQIFITIEVKSLLFKVTSSIIYSISLKRNCIPFFPWQIRWHQLQEHLTTGAVETAEQPHHAWDVAVITVDKPCNKGNWLVWLLSGGLVFGLFFFNELKQFISTKVQKNFSSKERRQSRIDCSFWQQLQLTIFGYRVLNKLIKPQQRHLLQYKEQRRNPSYSASSTDTDCSYTISQTQPKTLNKL